MRLKRLEMVGFKSFADKTRVEFEAGVTAVIGPNGCGKSNISDAIRWALGEMSARSLRSQQMLDVIFNGTAHRASQGLSEVTLTFDNTSGQLPIDYTEVSVSRRLFRSGESEYFLNKTQCRLKDIRDLFLDTGIGNDGYYVMAQGKIEFILAAKPEERRELFEEAAGVSKYKARREEALRKLSRVEQDMLRLNDSLAIYKQQIDQLDAAVRKARQHQKLLEEARRLEIAALLQSLEQNRLRSEDAGRRRQDAEDRLTREREDLSHRETALAGAREESAGLEHDVLELQRQLGVLESDAARAEAEKQAAIERATEIRAVQERLAKEALQLEADLGQWRDHETVLSGEVESLRLEYHQAHDLFKEEDRQVQAEQDALHGRQREMESVKTRVVELARLISHHRNEVVRLTSQVVRQEEIAKAKDRELTRVQERRSACAEQIQRQESLTQEASGRLEAVESQLKVLDDQQEQSRTTLSAQDAEIQSLREQMAGLEAEKAALERWLAQDPSVLASQALRQEALPGVHGPVSQLLKVSEPFQRLLERALGDRAHFFVAETLNDAQEAVRYLSDGRRGWATFLVLDRLAEAQQLHPWPEASGTRTLADVVECEEKFRPVLTALLGRTYYLGETLFEETLIRGGAAPEKTAIQATPTDLARLESELAQKQNALSDAGARRESLMGEIATRDAQRGPVTEDRQRLQVDERVQSETLTRLKDDLQMAETEEKLLVRERQDAQQAIAQHQTAQAQEEILLTTLEEEEKSLQQDVLARDAALQDLRQAVQARQTQISHLRVQAETLRERLLGREKELENARARLASGEQRLAQVQQERAQNDERLVQLEALQAEKATWLTELSSGRQSQQTLLAGLQERRQEILDRLRTEESALAELRQSVESAQRSTQEAEFEARALDTETARLAEALQQSHQLSVEEARAGFGAIAADAEELARIRRRLDSLGAFNLAAPEEHAQLEERYQFLLTQQQDLLKAKDDLHQAILKINATTREHFKATFEEVRGHFRGLYQQLFQGGEADLVLTDEHNLLETGVEIVAQPPGKKLQNIALLSGGEKALTTIALLFAFFLVKPSPFCLLDEVDAPLDEANVGRFVSMVKTFSEKTQFIVITHNKRTMEMADVLYGVTMAELGISSLISVKLESSRSPEPVAA